MIWTFNDRSSGAFNNTDFSATSNSAKNPSWFPLRANSTFTADNDADADNDDVDAVDDDDDTDADGYVSNSVRNFPFKDISHRNSNTSRITMATINMVE
mmetsp:Transcript_32227/g.36650  ORF Transcript_32227/g.36650 Transcript_32227/m.36650 type:complete len:99 (-) Transcript_32227:161-457(-)